MIEALIGAMAIGIYSNLGYDLLTKSNRFIETFKERNDLREILVKNNVVAKSKNKNSTVKKQINELADFSDDEIEEALLEPQNLEKVFKNRFFQVFRKNCDPIILKEYQKCVISYLPNSKKIEAILGVSINQIDKVNTILRQSDISIEIQTLINNNIEEITLSLNRIKKTMGDMKNGIGEIKDGMDVLLERNSQISQVNGDIFRYLDYYREEDSDYFYGRESETREILRCLENKNLVVLHGESGAGKSSLLNAGLLQKIKANEITRNLVPTPLRCCNKNFIEDLCKQITDSLQNIVSKPPVLERRSCDEFIREVITVLSTQECNLFLALDQFEEFFTHGLPQEDELREMIGTVIKNPSDNLKILLVIRKEYFDILTDWMRRKLGTEIGISELIMLKRFDRYQATEVIFKSFHVCGMDIEKQVVNDIISELETYCREEGIDEFVVYPPHLKIVTSRLYEACKYEQTVSLDMYRELGSAGKIVESYFERLVDEFPENQRHSAWKVLEALVAREDLRDRLSTTEIMHYLHDNNLDTEKPRLKIILSELTSRWIIRSLPGSEFELTHDSLAKHIFERLEDSVRNKKRIRSMFRNDFYAWKERGFIPAEEKMKFYYENRDSLLLADDEFHFAAISVIKRHSGDEFEGDYSEWFNDKRTIQALIYQLENDEDSWVKSECAELLGIFSAKKAIPILIEVLKYDEEEVVRSSCAEALGKLNAEEAIPTLITALSEMEENLGRSSCVDALGRLNAQRAIPLLIELLKSDDDEYVRNKSAEALGVLKANDAVSVLRQSLLNDTSDVVRSSCANALGNMGRNEAIPPLIEALSNDKILEVRIESIDALAKLRATESIPYLITILESKSKPNLIIHALIALAELNAKESIPTMITTFTIEGKKEVKEKCVEALVKLNAKEGVPYFVNVLEGSQKENYSVRLLCAEALGKLGIGETKSVLLETMKRDRSTNVRAKCVDSLVSLRATEYRQIFIDRFKIDKPSVVAHYAIALGKFGAPNASEMLINRMNNDMNSEVKRSCALGLYFLGREEGFSYLIDGLQNNSDSYERGNIADLLSETDERAIPYLEKALGDKGRAYKGKVTDHVRKSIQRLRKKK